MREDEQLHRPLSENARVPWIVSFDGGINFKSAGGFPFFTWPDGRMCFEANAYFSYYLLNKKISLRERGGSLREYAFQISAFIRFLYHNKISVLEMTDSHFQLFMEGLSVPLDSNGRQLRSRSRIRIIGSRCLDFMAYVSAYFGYPAFVSKKGAVEGQKVDAELRKKLKRKVAGITWYHKCFPITGKKNKRFPINDPEIKGLQKATLKKTLFLRNRSKILLSVLQYTGARRYEAAHIRVPDILRAFSLNEVQPLVRIITVKRGEIIQRFVPVPKTVISTWVNFIKIHRREVIHRTLGDTNDHGYLFVSKYTGKRLAVITITNEISALRVEAGFSAPAHPHLFRHRFITDMLARLIHEYDLENSDQLRNALAGSEAIRKKLQEWSGHALPESLDVYITEAFKIVANLDPAIKGVIKARSRKFVIDQVSSLAEELEQKLITEKEYYASVTELLDIEIELFKSE
jgi:integrase